MTVSSPSATGAASLGHRAASRGHPVLALIARRVGLGVITLFVVSVVIFAATEALPGNAAQAILGHSATPAQLHALEVQLHLNRSIFSQYGSWIGGVLSGQPGYEPGQRPAGRQRRRAGPGQLGDPRRAGGDRRQRRRDRARRVLRAAQGLTA